MIVSEEERKKQDSDYINRGLAKEAPSGEAGSFEGGSSKARRIPIGGVEVNGERFEIGIHPSTVCLTLGDWVMVSNPNDAEKPIVAQIFKTWQTSKYVHH